MSLAIHYFSVLVQDIQVLSVAFIPVIETAQKDTVPLTP